MTQSKPEEVTMRECTCLLEDQLKMVRIHIHKRDCPQYEGAYEQGYSDGENSGHADVVAYLDTDTTDWKKALEERFQQKLEEVKGCPRKDCPICHSNSTILCSILETLGGRK